MITDRIGRHDILLPLLIKENALHCIYFICSVITPTYPRRGRTFYNCGILFYLSFVCSPSVVREPGLPRSPKKPSVKTPASKLTRPPLSSKGRCIFFTLLATESHCVIILNLVPRTWNLLTVDIEVKWSLLPTSLFLWRLATIS